MASWWGWPLIKRAIIYPKIINLTILTTRYPVKLRSVNWWYLKKQKIVSKEISGNGMVCLQKIFLQSHNFLCWQTQTIFIFILYKWKMKSLCRFAANRSSGTLTPPSRQTICHYHISLIFNFIWTTSYHLIQFSQLSCST